MGCGLCSAKKAHKTAKTEEGGTTVCGGEDDGPRAAGHGEKSVTPLSSPASGRPVAWRSSGAPRADADSAPARRSPSHSEAERSVVSSADPPPPCTEVKCSSVRAGGQNTLCENGRHDRNNQVVDLCPGRGGDDERLRAAAASPAIPPELLVLDFPMDPRGAVEPERSTDAYFEPMCKNLAQESRSSSLSKRCEASLATLSDEPEEPHAMGSNEKTRITPKPAFPDVEVAMSSRILLLQWAKWGRNSWRIKEEENIKAMQHIKHPRTERRPYTPMASPQPTPRDLASPSATDILRPAEESGKVAAVDPKQVQEIMAARHRSSGTASRQGRNDVPKATWADDMKQEQRDSMNEQGTKLSLAKKLGAGATVAQSSGTPGFGIETPNFVGVKSRNSISADASIASSGVTSPLADGQMSPWLLEAEALVNGEDDLADDIRGNSKPATMAWGMFPVGLEQIPEMSGFQAAVKVDKLEARSLSEEFATIEDEDELDSVLLFVPTEASTRKNVEAVVGLENDDLDFVTGASESTTAAPTSTSSPLSSACGDGKAPTPLEAAGRYTPGDLVKYWSASHGVWLPARVIEKRSRSVYLIDKQMRGCFSKVRASDIVSEAEERHDPILRAMGELEREEREVKIEKKPQVPKYANLPSETLKRDCRPASSPAPPSARGCIVRDDFSDDSDD